MSTHNPFAPPAADFDEVPSQGAPIRKPRSVWVIQVLGVLFALNNASGFILSIYRAISLQILSQGDFRDWLHLAWQLFLVLALLLMLQQLPKRSRLGRNLGLGMIAMFTIGGILTGPGPSSANVFYTAGQWMGVFMFLALLAYFAYAFAFSEKARLYFSKTGQG